MKTPNNWELGGSLIFPPYSASEITAYEAANPPVNTLISDGSQILRFDGTSFVVLGGNGSSSTNEFIRLETDGVNDNLINRNVTTYSNVAFNGTNVITDTSLFAFVGQDSARTLFTGRVRAYYVFPHTSTGQRISMLTRIRRTRTTPASTLELCDDYSYIRSASGHNEDSNNGVEIYDCVAGDDFSLIYRRVSNVTAAVNIVGKAVLILEKLND